MKQIISREFYDLLEFIMCDFVKHQSACGATFGKKECDCGFKETMRQYNQQLRLIEVEEKPMIPELKNCHDCGTKPGETHMPGCDTERCSYCGGQCLMCGGCPDESGKIRHDPAFARWTGLWPGSAEAAELGLWVKWTDQGWEKCDKNDPDARPDLNSFITMGYSKIFFVKPTKDKGSERYAAKSKVA
jgi:hypothetical protein